MIKYFYEALSVLVGALIIGFNYLYIAELVPLAAPLLNMAGALIAVAPPSFLFYSKFKARKEMEEQFLVFVSNLTDSIDTGMTLPMALEHCAKGDYLSLTPHVKRMASEVNWGIPFEKALSIFSKNVNLLIIRRAVTTIIETYKVGGKISDTLSAVGKSLLIIEKIKKERSVSVHAQILTSYLIYFVFIFILVVLQIFLIPALMPTQQTSGMVYGEAVSVAAESTGMSTYTSSFINFIIIQGFFAGLVTGKMSENSIASGFKHSILLIVVGYTVFSFASQFQMNLF